MATSPVVEPKVPEAENFKVKARVFSLDSFERVTLEGDATFTPVTSIQEGLAKLEGKPEIVVDAINAYLRRSAAKEVRHTLISGASNVVPNIAVASFVAPLRNNKKFRNIENARKQRAAILDELKV